MNEIIDKVWKWIKRGLIALILVVVLSFAMFVSALFGVDRAGTCLGIEEYTSFYTNVPAKPSTLAFKHNYGLCYAGRRTCTGAKYNNPDYRTNGDNIVVRITGAWSGWSYALRSSVCTMLDKEDNNSTLSTEEIPYRINTGPTESNPNAIGFLDDDENYLSPEEQEACWYNSGDGLYIGFFDRLNDEETDKLYHMRTSEVQCPVQYRNNENDINWRDRTVGDCQNCACVEKVCEDANSNDIYEDGECSYYNRAIAIFNFDQTHGKGIIEPNKYVKFKILDRYHLDNQGSYTLEFTNGIGQIEKSVISFLIEGVENFTLGEIQTDGITREGGFIKKFFNNVVSNNIFTDILRVCLIFYVVLFGFGIITGRTGLTTHELMRRGLTVSIILLFTSSTSWEYFNTYVISFFLNLAKLNLFGGASNAITLLDSKIMEFFTSDYIHIKIFSLAFSPLSVLGFVLVLLFYVFLTLFALTIGKVLYAYLFSFIQLIISFIIFPFIIILFLFDFTKGTLMNWLSLVTAKAMEMMMILLAANILIEFVVQNFSKIVWLYDVCYKDIEVLFFHGAMPYINNGELGWMQLFNEMFVLIMTSILYLGAMWLIIDIIIQIGNKIGAINSKGGIGYKGSGSFSDLFKMASSVGSTIGGLSIMRPVFKATSGLAGGAGNLTKKAGGAIASLPFKAFDTAFEGVTGNKMDSFNVLTNPTRKNEFNSSFSNAMTDIKGAAKNIAEKGGDVSAKMNDKNISVRDMIADNYTNLQREKSEGLYSEFESLMEKNIPTIEDNINKLFDDNVNGTFASIYKGIVTDNLKGIYEGKGSLSDREFYDSFAKSTKAFLERDGMSFDGVRTYNTKELNRHINSTGGVGAYLGKLTQKEGLDENFAREVMTRLHPDAGRLLNSGNILSRSKKLDDLVNKLEELDQNEDLSVEELKEAKEEIVRDFVGEVKIEVGQDPFEMMKTDIEIIVENELIAGLQLGEEDEAVEQAEDKRKEMKKNFTKAQVKLAKIDLKIAQSEDDADPTKVADFENKVKSLEAEFDRLSD